LLHPPTEKQAMWAILIEPNGSEPYFYVDGNLDNTLSKEERYSLAQEENNNPYILQAVAEVQLKGTTFQSMP
jgi:hypothetical protein